MSRGLLLPIIPQSLLHIAIVKSSVDMVKFLLKTCPELLLCRATGQFFRPGGACYYGEFPLSFAVCTNQPDLVRILLDAQADPTRKDSMQGNHALHMAVLHNHTDMYDLLVDEWKARRHMHAQWAGGDTCLSMLPNNAGQQTLALAAAEGSAEMFDYVLTRAGQVVWTAFW